MVEFGKSIAAIMATARRVTYSTIGRRAVLHAALVLILTTKIIIFNLEDSSYTRSMNKNWSYYFNPYGWNKPHNNVQLFTVNDTVHALNDMLSTYGQLSNISLATFTYRHSAGGYCQDTPTIIQAETLYWIDANSLGSYITDITSPEDLDFITQNTTSYFRSLDTLKLTMWLCNTHDVANPYSISGKPTHTRCYMWAVQILYRFVSQTYINVEINDELNGACTGTETALLYSQSHSIWLEVSSLLVAVLYLVATCMTLRKAWQYFLAVKAAHSKARVLYLHRAPDSAPGVAAAAGGGGGGAAAAAAASADGSWTETNSEDRAAPEDPLLPRPSAEQTATTPTPSLTGHQLIAQYEWEEIPFSVKRRFLPLWLLLTLVGILLATADAAYRIYFKTEYIPTTGADKLLLGVACMLLWGTVLQFLTFDPRVYSIAQTISTALPRITPYFVGFVPVILAFIVLAISIWGAELGAFSTLGAASRTLFALTMGDQVHDMLTLMQTQSPLTAIFAVAYVTTTLYLVMNIVISIVEESYFHSRSRKRHLFTLIENRLAEWVDSSSGRARTRSRAQTQSSRKRLGSGGLSPRRAVGGAGGGGKDVDEGEDEDPRESDDDDEAIAKLLSSASAGPEEGPGALQLTHEELAAEVYLLGSTHLEYSKIMDLLAQRLIEGGAFQDHEGENEVEDEVDAQGQVRNSESGGPAYRPVSLETS